MTHKILDRHNIFPYLKEAISEAKHMVLFDAYIWIDNRIGREVLEACLTAADRGVKIFIRKDLSALIFEHTPGRIPMFIPKEDKTDGAPDNNTDFGVFSPKILDKIGFYIYGKKPRPPIKELNPLFLRAVNHPNVHINIMPVFNHGKLIIIDDSVFVGGQCISDDYENWIDYNLKITDRQFTDSTLKAILYKDTPGPQGEISFINNVFPKKGTNRSIQHFLKEFIETSRDELIIEMSYLSLWYVPIISTAAKRGLKIKMLLSRESDTNHHTNMWFIQRLLSTKNQNIELFFHKKNMIHTKGLATRERATIGAANFHNASGYHFGLDEQNVLVADPTIAGEIYNRFKMDIEQSDRITDASTLPKWNKRSALLEIFFIWLSSYITLLRKGKIRQYRYDINKPLEEYLSAQ